MASLLTCSVVLLFLLLIALVSTSTAVKFEQTDEECPTLEGDSLLEVAEKICEFCHEITSHEKPNMRSECRSVHTGECDPTDGNEQFPVDDSLKATVSAGPKWAWLTEVAPSLASRADSFTITICIVNRLAIVLGPQGLLKWNHDANRDRERIYTAGEKRSSCFSSDTFRTCVNIFSNPPTQPRRHTRSRHRIRHIWI